MAVSGSLNASGITDPRLRSAYRFCGRYLRQRAPRFYGAGLILPHHLRPYFMALVCFAEYTYDLMYCAAAHARGKRLERWADATYADWDNGLSTHPVRQAYLHTARTYTLPSQMLHEFFAWFRRDVSAAEFATYPELAEHHRLAHVGWSRPVLALAGQALPADAVESAIVAVAEPIQLTNALCDLAVDLAVGRCVLPAEDLDLFGVRRTDLCAGRWSKAVSHLVFFEVHRAQNLFAILRPMRSSMHPLLRPLLRASIALWEPLLDDVLAAGPTVLHRPIRRPLLRRVAAVMPAYWEARRAYRLKPLLAPTPAALLP